MIKLTSLCFMTAETNSDKSFFLVSPPTRRFAACERYRRPWARVQATYNNRLQYRQLSITFFLLRKDKLTALPRRRLYGRTEKFLARLRAIKHIISHKFLSRNRWWCLPAGTITTGHSSPLAAWQVDSVTFYGRDEEISTQN